MLIVLRVADDAAHKANRIEKYVANISASICGSIPAGLSSRAPDLPDLF